MLTKGVASIMALNFVASTKRKCITVAAVGLAGNLVCNVLMLLMQLGWFLETFV